MSVELDPPELGFRRPFTQEVSQVLRLHNPNSDPVAFKVKTTAPKQYCVRPNSGRIDSGRDVEVQVLLQAMKEDPPPDARCRDKFLVQSVAVSPDSDAANVNQIWSNIEQNAKSSIQERKIRVTFLPADGGATTNGVAAAGAGAAGGLAAGGAAAAAYSTSRADEPPAYSSNTPAVTPQKPQDNSNFAETPAGDSSLPSQSAARAMTSNATTTDPDTNSSTTSAIPAAIPQNQEDLKAQLDEAKKTIQQLQTQAQEGLRQRKPQEAMESAKQTLQQASEQTPGGVSVQITAILCLVCFLIAWLFF